MCASRSLPFFLARACQSRLSVLRSPLSLSVSLARALARSLARSLARTHARPSVGVDWRARARVNGIRDLVHAGTTD